MKKLITLVYSFLSFVILYAQECDPASIMSIKGKWINGEDNIVSPEPSFPRSLYKELNKRIDKIAALFQKAYPDPLGIEAKWYRSIRGWSLIPNGPVPYQFNSLYKSWYCNKNVNKLMLGSETGTWAYV